MKYIKYSAVAMVAVLFLSLLNAKSTPKKTENVDFNAINLIDEEQINLDFNTSEYLPDGFNPYQEEVSMDGINFMEYDEVIDLGFDTTAFLPENFDPYKR